MAPLSKHMRLHKRPAAEHGLVWLVVYHVGTQGRVLEYPTEDAARARVRELCADPACDTVSMWSARCVVRHGPVDTGVLFGNG